MKDIIVAIDFSAGSLHALDYAIAFANHVKSNLMMVWVNNQLTPDTFNGEVNPYKDEAVKNFEDILKTRKDLLVHGKLSYKLRRGKVYQEIAAQAKSINAGLIIAGTHGVTGYEEFWIGSNAYRIVSYAPCPVITVRYDFQIKPEGIRNIVLPIDSSADTRQKIPFAVQLAKGFNADIHILAIYSTSLKSVQRRVENSAMMAQRYVQDAGLKYTLTTQQAENITNSTLEHAQAVDADLITIMTEQETNAANILLGPFAQQMVNYSHIPVLSIQPKEIYEISTR
ncbi:MAG: universal stress protein [Chloroflexota bacterium]|nr:universal stress protein [Lentimicrobium sp.]